MFGGSLPSPSSPSHISPICAFFVQQFSPSGTIPWRSPGGSTQPDSLIIPQSLTPFDRIDTSNTEESRFVTLSGPSWSSFFPPLSSHFFPSYPDPTTSSHKSTPPLSAAGFCFRADFKRCPTLRFLPLPLLFEKAHFSGKAILLILPNP